MRTCEVRGCSGKPYARGLCQHHYQRWYRDVPEEPEPPAAGKNHDHPYFKKCTG